MIEYLLLFSLGFLSAAFLAFLIAPAIQKRVVLFTENRIRATLPLSPQELKAQKDMVRAQYAAENAKLSQAVIAEREKGVEAETRAERILSASHSVAAAKADMEISQQVLEERVRELEVTLRGEDEEILDLRQTIATSKSKIAEDTSKIEELSKRIAYLSDMSDAHKIDLAARDTEIDSMHASINMLISERDKARDLGREAEERARAAELRLSREVNKVMRLQDRLDRELAAGASRENALNRRVGEIARMRDRLKSANAQARSAVRLLKDAGIDMPLDLPPVDTLETEEDVIADVVEDTAVEIDMDALVMGLYADEKDVSEELLNEPPPEEDDKLRDRIASIAARMVALTAEREGESSPLRKLLSVDGAGSAHGRLSLGERSAKALHGEDA